MAQAQQQSEPRTAKPYPRPSPVPPARWTKALVKKLRPDVYQSMDFLIQDDGRPYKTWDEYIAALNSGDDVLGLLPE